jgi:hypothetical protein
MHVLRQQNGKAVIGAYQEAISIDQHIGGQPFFLVEGHNVEQFVGAVLDRLATAAFDGADGQTQALVGEVCGSAVRTMADRGAALQSAIEVALSSPKAALAHIGWMRAERWLKTLSSPELWCIREVLVDESRPGFPPRLLECIASNDARRAAGDLESGARNLLDPATLAFFARRNGFPRTPARPFLPDYDELIAADLLWRYGWTASEAGLAFDDWETEHRQEMLEIMKQISAISGSPTPQEARIGGGSR